MGYSISWLAVKDRKLADLLEDLELADSGELEDSAESDISGADLPNGWCHLQMNDFNSPITSKEVLSSLSAETVVVGCFIEEHVMYSKSVCWIDKAFQWEIEHDAQIGIENLTCKGNLPDDSELVREQQLNLQAGEDSKAPEVDFIFEIPLLVSRNLCGYKHDEIVGEFERTKYHILASETVEVAGSKPWWKFW